MVKRNKMQKFQIVFQRITESSDLDLNVKWSYNFTYKILEILKFYRWIYNKILYKIIYKSL